MVDLDSKIYKKVAGLNKLLEGGVPSIKDCSKLAVKVLDCDSLSVLP